MMHSPAAVSALIVSNPSDGGAVDEDEIVVRGDRRERLTQARFARERRDELDVGAGQVDRRRHEEEQVDLGLHDDLLERNLLQQHVVDVVREARLVDAETGRRVALRVAVHDEHALAEHRECRAEVDGRRALADAAFLVDERDDATQGLSPKFLCARRAGTLEILLEDS